MFSKWWRRKRNLAQPPIPRVVLPTETYDVLLVDAKQNEPDEALRRVQSTKPAPVRSTPRSTPSPRARTDGPFIAGYSSTYGSSDSGYSGSSGSHCSPSHSSSDHGSSSSHSSDSGSSSDGGGGGSCD